MKSKRQSGLELLRIIAMLLIIAHHYSVHGGFETFTIENISRGSIFIQLLWLFGKPSCSIFALISGFFLVNSVNIRTHYKKLGSLCGTVIFYGMLFLILAVTAFNVNVDRTQVFSSFLPFAGHNWYVRDYIFLYLLVPFINPLLKSMTRRRFTQFILLLFVSWSVLPSLGVFSSAFNGVWTFCEQDFFLIMYVFGAYIRLHIHGKVQYNNRWNLIVAIGSTVLLCVSLLGVIFIAYALDKGHLLDRIATIESYNFPLCVIWAVSLFLYFNNLEFKSEAINRLGMATFGVYLIHDHPLIRSLIWQNIYPNANYASSPYLHALIKIFAVFCISAAIELLRAATIGKWFDRWFAGAYDRAFEKLDARRLRKRRGIQ